MSFSRANDSSNFMVRTLSLSCLTYISIKSSHHSSLFTTASIPIKNNKLKRYFVFISACGDNHSKEDSYASLIILCSSVSLPHHQSKARPNSSLDSCSFQYSISATWLVPNCHL